MIKEGKHYGMAEGYLKALLQNISDGHGKTQSDITFEQMRNFQEIKENMFIVHCFYLLVVILLSFLEKIRLIRINMFLSSTNNLSPL